MNAPWDDFEAYQRQCTNGTCEHVFNTPSIDELIEGEMICPVCRAEYNVDEDDMCMLIAWLLARVERLERKDNPFAGIDL